MKYNGAPTAREFRTLKRLYNGAKEWTGFTFAFTPFMATAGLSLVMWFGDGGYADVFFATALCVVINAVCAFIPVMSYFMYLLVNKTKTYAIIVAMFSLDLAQIREIVRYQEVSDQ